jgi:hypothetical protein
VGADLEDGRRIIGQHRLTGKETPPIDSPIRRVFLCDASTGREADSVPVAEEVIHGIDQADLICFPMGSFYTSLLVNLLPRGVAEAIRANPCPKVYVPNTGHDPEQLGLSLPTCVHKLLEQLDGGTGYRPRRGDPAAVERCLNAVIVDSRSGQYASPVALHEIEEQGVQVLDVTLVTDRTAPHLDEHLLVPTLLSLT